MKFFWYITAISLIVLIIIDQPASDSLVRTQSNNLPNTSMNYKTNRIEISIVLLLLLFLCLTIISTIHLSR